MRCLTRRRRARRLRRRAAHRRGSGRLGERRGHVRGGGSGSTRPDPQCYGLWWTLVATEPLDRALATLHTAEAEPRVSSRLGCTCGRACRRRRATCEACVFWRSVSRASWLSGGNRGTPKGRRKVVGRRRRFVRERRRRGGGRRRCDPGQVARVQRRPAVEAEVVMCEAEAKAAAGDADGRGPRRALEKLDYSRVVQGSPRQVHRVSGLPLREGDRQQR